MAVVDNTVFDMGGCQNYGPLLEPYYNTASNIYGTPKKETIILTTTHILIEYFMSLGHCLWVVGFKVECCYLSGLGFKV